ncbi:germin-like protein subfamily 2 member 4 [Momordica charantia]|uniref:Germin-like protein n=1 Tax=Momordica charantia TaxID=3673 RepID=A0A6J1CXW0_MOMCH|nr:germin-like protein subfamily 2 member 4 [Momordica charantia]
MFWAMAESKIFIFFTILFAATATIPRLLASDPDLLQDLCVAAPSKGIKVNGFPCKDEANVTALDFFFAGLANAAAINNSVGSAVTAANVDKIPGLNTLGVSLARVDYSPAGGLNPPHVHPRATEIVFVLDGELDVGFITTANKLVAKTIKKGEVFVFPKGLLHFQRNSKDKPASVIAAFNSQLPGTQSVAAALFGASPAVDDAVLAGAFQIGGVVVGQIKSKIAPKKKK